MYVLHTYTRRRAGTVTDLLQLYSSLLDPRRAAYEVSPRFAAAAASAGWPIWGRLDYSRPRLTWLVYPSVPIIKYCPRRSLLYNTSIQHICPIMH